MEASDSERMEELKKAYVEIILNTAKESARRVVASEEKARRYERVLSNSKSEALRLLLRLKHMISAKEIEAEITYPSRIDELEAQLQEAEGVIVDLRAELDWTRDRLQEVKRNRLKPLDGNTGKDDCVLEQKCATEAEPITTCSSGSQFEASITDKDMAQLNREIGDEKCCKEKQLVELIGPSSFENRSSSDSEIASRMLKSKEHLENVFWEKDYAVDGKMLPEKSTLLESVNAHSVMTHDLVIKARHELEEKCNASFLKTRNVERMKKLLGESRNVVEAITLNRRKGWRGKATTNCSSHLTKPCQRPSILSRCRTYPMNDRLLTTLCNTQTSDAIEVKLLHQNSCSLDKNVIVHEVKIQPNMENKDVVLTTFVNHDDQQLKGRQSPPGPSHCTSYSLSISDSVKSKLTENGVKLRPLRPGKTLIKGVGVPLSSSKTVVGNVKAVNEPGIFCGGANKQTESEHGCVEVGPKVSLKSKDDYGKASVPLEQVKEPGAAVASVPLEVSDYSDGRTFCEPYQSPNQVVGNELLKYTFRQKRKKEQLTILDQNLNPERTKVETKALDDIGGSLVPQKSRSINNSSRENRHTAQVALQLISLSAKRRCQK